MCRISMTILTKHTWHNTDIAICRLRHIRCASRTHTCNDELATTQQSEGGDLLLQRRRCYVRSSGDNETPPPPLSPLPLMLIYSATHISDGDVRLRQSVELNLLFRRRRRRRAGPLRRSGNVGRRLIDDAGAPARQRPYVLRRCRRRLRLAFFIEFFISRLRAVVFKRKGRRCCRPSISN